MMIKLFFRETTELRSQHRHVPFERLRNNGWCGADETGSLYSYCDTSFTVDTTRRVCLGCSLRISKLMIREEEEEEEVISRDS